MIPRREIFLSSYVFVILSVTFSSVFSQDYNTHKFILVDPVSGKPLTIQPGVLSVARTLTFPDASGTFLTSGLLGSTLALSAGLLGVVDNSSAQKIIVASEGTDAGTRHKMNFIAGTNVTLTVSDDNANDRVNLTIASSGGGGSSFADNVFEIKDDADNTKKFVFEASGIAAGTTRTLTLANASGKIITDGNKSDLFPLSYSVSSSSTLFDLTNSGTASSLASTYSGTTDMKLGVYGRASGNGASNHVIGVWGDASDASSTNTSAIGVLATGGGNTTTGTSAVPNVALQLNDGELTMGRTTETGTGYTSSGLSSPSEDAAGSSGNYSADGPSGIIEIPYPGASDLNFGSTVFANYASGLQIFNKYAKSNSIILVEVLQQIEGTTNQAIIQWAAKECTFATAIKSRATGSFKLTVDVFNTTGANTSIDGGSAATDKDKIRVGYVIINPSK